MNVLRELPAGARILVIRIRSLGDCVLTTPALALLKQARPDCPVAVAVEPAFRDVFARNPDVDVTLAPVAGEVARFRPSLSINLHGGTRSLFLAGASRARWRAGFEHFRASWLYNVRIPAAQTILGVNRTVHTAEHLASAIFFLGAPRTEIPRARLFAQPIERRDEYAVIHPFASKPAKTWPADRFRDLASRLQSDLGLRPVFIGGAGDDFSEFAPFDREAGAPLDRVKSLLAGASLFVGNDSGPAHVAAALNVRAVVLFGDSDPVVWAPWKARAEQIVAEGAIADVPVDRVAQAAGRIAMRESPRA